MNRGRRLARWASLVGLSLATTAGLGVAVSTPAAAATPNTFVWSRFTRIQARTSTWALNSRSGVYRARFQRDGNWVVYHGGRAIWSSRTACGSPNLGVLDFGGAGTMNIISAAGTCNKTWVHYPAVFRDVTYRIVMQNDGNFVQYTGRTGGHPVWASNTVGR